MAEADALTAVLLQLGELTQKLADLDHRQIADVNQMRERIAALTALANGIKGTIADQAEVLAALDGLDEQVAALAARMAKFAPADDSESQAYSPSPSPRFWKLEGAARDEAIAKLRAWVEQVYQPGYGHLSAGLGECWDQHPLCLYGLDWLSELWSVLYLQSKRTTGVLAGQAEWQTRLLTAVAEQLADETRRCRHAVVRSTMPRANGALR